MVFRLFSFSTFPCDTFSDVHTVSGKTPEGKVLGTTPWFDCNTSYTGKISNHIGIMPSFFPMSLKDFL